MDARFHEPDCVTVQHTHAHQIVLVEILHIRYAVVTGRDEFVFVLREPDGCKPLSQFYMYGSLSLLLQLLQLLGWAESISCSLLSTFWPKHVWSNTYGETTKGNVRNLVLRIYSLAVAVQWCCSLA